MEKEIDGEQGGGVEAILSSLDMDNVDFRLNQLGLAARSNLVSEAVGPGAWLVVVCGLFASGS